MSSTAAAAVVQSGATGPIVHFHTLPFEKVKLMDLTYAGVFLPMFMQSERLFFEKEYSGKTVIQIDSRI